MAGPVLAPAAVAPYRGGTYVRRMEPLNPEILRWVEHVIGPGAEVVDTTVLRPKETQPTWLLHLKTRGTSMHAVLKVSPAGCAAIVQREAATLQLLATIGIRAPRLLGVATGGHAESLLLETFLPGSNDQRTRSPLLRMRALGAAAAHLHATTLPPHHTLARIKGPVWHDHFIAERQQGQAPTTPLLQAAEQLWASYQPDGRDVLVHGDLHHANVLWDGDSIVALIDWDSTGTGNPGIDLGWARLEATLAYSTAAADQITPGWVDITGNEPESLAYWDLIAALQNHAHIGDRTYGRNQFLQAAMKRIDAS